MENVKRVADVGFEDYYNKAVEQKEFLYDEIMKKAEEEFATKSAKLDLIIENTSHEEVEAVADEPVVEAEPVV